LEEKNILGISPVQPLIKYAIAESISHFSEEAFFLIIVWKSPSMTMV
jgi:hypothetical protein